MNICPMCGLSLSRAGICPHHLLTEDTDWHVTNRIMCDYFHRQTPIDRQNKTEQVDCVLGQSGLFDDKEFDTVARAMGREEKKMAAEAVRNEKAKLERYI